MRGLGAQGVSKCSRPLASSSGFHPIWKQSLSAHLQIREKVPTIPAIFPYIKKANEAKALGSSVVQDPRHGTSRPMQL